MTCVVDLQLAWKDHSKDLSFQQDGTFKVSFAPKFPDSRNFYDAKSGSRSLHPKPKETQDPISSNGCHQSTSSQNSSKSTLHHPVQNGQALQIYEEYHDLAALLNLIKTCCKHKDLHRGFRIHANILERGLLERDIAFGNALLSMYVKCGALTKALELFDQLTNRDVVTWNALISGYVQHGHGNEALRCYDRMREEGLSPDVITYVCILKACGSIRAMEMGEKLHEELDKQGLLGKHVALDTALVDMYARCGELAKAQVVFNKLPSRDVVAWNVLIAGYAQHGFNDDALSCFGKMQHEGLSPNAITYVCSLKACGNAGAIDKGEDIHTEVDRQGLLETNIVLGTALVDMYAKCGALAKAQGVFNQMPLRNIVTWNALIAGYVHQGLAPEALAFFEQMRNEGISPDVVTFQCILKACASMRAIEKGEEIHAEVSRLGLLVKEDSLGTGLVDMYAKCGALDKAQGVFDKLSTRDVASWTALISGYAEHGRSEEALSCFKQMQDEGLSPDSVAFLCILKACGSIGAVEKGEEIHAEVSRQGLLENDTVLGTAVVDMYAKCGALSKAQGVFDKLPKRNSVTWNVLIAGYAQHGFFDKAISCFRQMRDQDLFPDVVAVVCILQACANKGLSEVGEDILLEIGWQELWKEDPVLGNALVNMYAKSGVLAKAQVIFDKLASCEVVTWNALISGYAQHGFHEEALRCFEKMKKEGVSADAITFVHILKACGNIGASEMGDEIFMEVDKQALLVKSYALGTALVDMYAKCGKLVKAQRVFDELPKRDVIAWNALISGYTQHGYGGEALKCFRQMRDEGISPDGITFACALKACGSISAAEKGEEILVEVSNLGLLKKDILLGTAVVDMYAKCGKLDQAQGVFDELPLRDVVTWNALIAGYVQNGLANEAISCFGCMQQEKVIFPNVVTFVCILKACSIIGALEMGEEVHDEIGRQAFSEKERVFTLGTALVDMYAKCGALKKADALFNNFSTKSVATWNALIAGYAQVGKARMVCKLFNNMIEECIVPDAVTFIVLFNAFSHAGLLEEGLKYFGTMTTVYSIVPDVEHMTCIVDNFSRTGNFDIAISIIENLPPSDCLSLWSVLMGSCQRSGAVELGTWVFEQLVHLNVKNSANFICLSNMYAAASMQEEAD